MNSRVRTGLLIAVAGFILIAVGIFLAIRFLNIDFGASTTPPPTPVAEAKTLVAFAVNDLPEGTVLTEQDVTLTEIPVQFAITDAITDLDNVIGRMSKTDLVSGEMILGHNLADPTGAAFDIAYVLDEKHVLMALPATDLMSRESIVKRGDIVDILVSIQEVIEPVAADEPQPPAQQVTFAAYQKMGVTAIVIDLVQNNTATAADTTIQGNANQQQRNQIIVQAYLIALNPQDALVLKYLKDIGAIFEFVIRAPTSSGQFELTPVTSQFIKEFYGLELLP